MYQDIGAVNTIVRGADGRLYGYNTDCDGALSAIEDGLRDTGQLLLINILSFA
jgi:3-dehydroquinate dehydratase/shikimate dehydrogenase